MEPIATMPAKPPETDAGHQRYVFGEFALDVDRGALLRDGVDINLRPKSFEVLFYLVERQGRLVSKTELLDSIWSPAVVTEDAVTQCLIDIRRAIHDKSQDKIRTIPRRGYIFELPVSKQGGSEAFTDTKTHVAAIADWSRWRLAVAFALVLIVGAAWWGFGTSGSKVPAGVESRSVVTSPSIAVLPFADMSPEQDQEYFADGISEEVLNLLTRVPGLRVIARTSSFSFKNQNADIADIAKRLNVTHVLEGSVRQSGNKMRVTAQLVNAANSEHIWSETYDRTPDDIFAIQDELSAEVVEQLRLSLFGAPDKVQTVDTRAYTLTLHARHLLNQYDPEHLPKIESFLRQALKIDPDFVMALTELARLYVHQGERGLRSLDEVEPLFHEVINRANEIEPDNGVVHIYLGYAPLMFDGDIRSGAPMIVRAIQLDPTNPWVVQWVQSYALSINRLDLVEALGLYVISRDPLCIRCQFDLGLSYLLTERYREAEKIFGTIAMIDSNHVVPAHFQLGILKLLASNPAAALKKFEQEENQALKSIGRSLANHDLGKMREFQAELEELRQMDDFGFLVGDDLDYWVAAIHAWVGDTEAALELLENGVAEDPGSYLYAFQQPLFRSLHEDPRWVEILNKTGTSPEQLASIDFDIPLLQ